MRELLILLTIVSMYSCVQNHRVKEEQILESIAIQYNDRFKENIERSESYMRENSSCKASIITSISQMEDYKGFKTFFIGTEFNINIDDLPTCLIKKEDRYIAMYLKERKILQKIDIPNILLKKCNINFLSDDGCYVFMCKECNKSIAIYMVEEPPYDMVTQIENFTHKCDHKWNGKVEIENAIIDTTKVFEMPPSPEE